MDSFQKSVKSMFTDKFGFEQVMVSQRLVSDSSSLVINDG